jgi:hypothetical protein
MLELAYVAGILDGEGSFQIQLNHNRKIVKNLAITPRIIIGFKKDKEESALLCEFQKQFGGKIYISNDGTEKAMVRWMTTKLDETVNVAATVLPLLHLKKSQCEKLLIVARVMQGHQDRRYIKGPTTSLIDIYSKDELQMIVKTATTMNAGRQNTKYRDTKGRNTDYYLELVDKMYGQCNDTTRIMETLP